MLDHSLGQTLRKIHDELKQKLPRLNRIAVAVYDAPTDNLKTFIHSSDGPTPLSLYEAKLTDVPSLHALAKSGQPRVIDNIEVLRNKKTLHSKKILDAGYLSSYTEPLFIDDHLLGFLFFDANEHNYFNNPAVNHLSAYCKLLTVVISSQLRPIKILNGAIAIAREFSKQRDEETANHLQRMSYYSRLIALGLATQHGLSDEEVEYIYQFAPLHDIGKIAITDKILLKADKLTAVEEVIMQTHVNKGIAMAQLMIDEFDLNEVHHIEILKNIIACHHERWNGSGYPHGLTGTLIPIEARVIAVADVFDALTSIRPYKAAWTIEAAFEYLQQNSDTLLDPDCVAAAVNNAEQFKLIHQQYQDPPV